MTHPKGIIDFIIVVRRCVLCVPFLSTAFVLTWRWNSVHVAQRCCQSFTKTIIILSKETPFSHLKKPLALSQFKKHSKFGCPKFQISRARKLFFNDSIRRWKNWNTNTDPVPTKLWPLPWKAHSNCSVVSYCWQDKNAASAHFLWSPHNLYMDMDYTLYRTQASST